VVAILEAKAEDDSVEDEIQADEEVADEGDEEEGDESDDVCISSPKSYHLSDLSPPGCRNYYGTNRSVSGLPVRSHACCYVRLLHAIGNRQNPPGRPAAMRNAGMTFTPTKRACRM
jgi:hypothetical protein